MSRYRITFRTRIVAGELTTDSLRLTDFGGSSRGLLDADVAIAKAEAAVEVLLLFSCTTMEEWFIDVFDSVKSVNTQIIHFQRLMFKDSVMLWQRSIFYNIQFNPQNFMLHIVTTVISTWVES